MPKRSDKKKEKDERRGRVISFKDMAFCARDCANEQCERNKVNIKKPKDLELMPVAFAEFKDCEEWEEKNAKNRNDKYGD